MMYELTVSNYSKSLNRLMSMVSKAKETSEVIEVLSAMGNNTAMALVEEQKFVKNYQVGYVLGNLKANFDSLPDEIAAKQKINGIPLNLFIKMKVDEYVLDVREKSYVEELTYVADYEGKYRRLSELICGFTFNNGFIEERFERFFPNGTHMFVLGFAVGYSEEFHEIASKTNIATEHTEPKSQDIWKNWEYFLKRNVYEYRIDGHYLFMYHGGFSSAANENIPYGKNGHYVNENVYERLRARNSSEFVDQIFDFKF